MRRRSSLLIAVLLFSCVHVGVNSSRLSADDRPAPPSAEAQLESFFEREVRELTENDALQGVGDLDAWSARRGELREELFDMLGLSPRPERGNLRAVTTGIIDRPDLGIVVEKVHFQSVPGLYVTGNLYRPRSFKGKLPAILYLCGHARVNKDGIDCGNKTAYQHHPIWFAKNGYVALAIDTVQLGEIAGYHHGTYHAKMWWWVARGYVPSGVEAWNSIRALDYLEGRPEVDAGRIGATGRSGGGVGTWWIGALDDRVQAMVPVAGVTDLKDHVIGGCVEGHCDCMFASNFYRWDFDKLVSMTAPRPLLLANSDKDGIFPLGGVYRLHSKLAKVYALHKQSAKLGLLITEGPHRDTQSLRVPAFRWMNRWLKNDIESLVLPSGDKPIDPLELRVFDKLPADQLNSRIHESFVPRAPTPAVLATVGAFSDYRKTTIAALEKRVFRNMPKVAPKSLSLPVEPRSGGGVQVWHHAFGSEEFYLPVDVVGRKGTSAKRLVLEIVANDGWSESRKKLRAAIAGDSSLAGTLKGDELRATFAPRGLGYGAWSGDARKLNQIRRRFLILGRTLESCRVLDVLNAVAFLREAHPGLPITLASKGDLGVCALYAAILDERIDSIDIDELPKSHDRGFALMNVLRVVDIPQALSLVFPRHVRLRHVARADFAWTASVADLWGKRRVLVWE